MNTTPIRVLLVDDHAIVRQGYRRLLEKHAGIVVVAEAANAADAYIQYKATSPDVVIMDITMPGRGGIDAAQQLRKLDPSARILIYSMHAGSTYAIQAIRAGAKGYVTKSSDPALLVEAVRKVMQGRPAFCPEISESLAASRVEEEINALEFLSPREFEILRMILEAKSTEEIATSFRLSTKTVANYHYAIKSKLGVSSDIDLVYFCMRHGLVAPLGAAP
jgi:DNA-binding NarL/FixJ family response regulator